MKIKGYATPEGTARYKSRFSEASKQGHFKISQNLHFSSVGIGSYLGELDPATDAGYLVAFKAAMLSGINVLDSAINYRAQRSEKCLGRALAELISAGKIARDEMIICTKGGFFPFEDQYPEDPAEYIYQTYFAKGLLKEEDVAQDCHAISPAYLENQLTKSLENLSLETIDIYYLHNPETQLMDFDRKTVLDRMRQAFIWLEKKVQEGKIRYYGTATWNGFRVGPEEKDYLALEELVVLAREAGGIDHHFKAIQLPMNVAMPEAWVIGNQKHGAGYLSALALAKRLNITAIGSASLLQGRLTGVLPDFFTQKFPSFKTSAQCSLQFARSIPGLVTALVGMKNENHVKENLEIVKSPVLSEEELILMFQNQGGES